MNSFRHLSLLTISLAGSMMLQAQRTRIPFEFGGKHIYVMVRAGDSDSLRFAFDSGCTGANIDSVAAKKAGVGKGDLQTVSVGGFDGVNNYMMANGERLKIGNVIIDPISFVILDLTGFSKIIGVRLDGIVGYEVLNSYVTKIDFDSKELSLYDAITEIDTVGYTRIPFEFNKGVLIPRFPITITTTGGEVFKGRVMFDTGNPQALTISAPYANYHDLRNKLGNTKLIAGRGVAGRTSELASFINGMAFNGFQFGKMAVTMTVNDAAEPKDGYLGIMGIEVIKRFNVILDYKNRMIYLKPNAAYSAEFSVPAILKE